MNSLKFILTNKRYFSVVWVFCSLNIMIGTWVLYIPNVKANLGLNDAQIGFALFCVALGIISFLPIVPYLIKKIGLGKLTFLGIVIFSLAFTLPVFINSYLALCIALFVVGIFSGVTDIAMNTLVSEMEKRDAVNIMSSAHGFFSLGGVIGASIGSLLIVLISVPFYHMVLIAVFIIIINIFLFKNYIHINESIEKKEGKNFSFKVLKPVIPVALIALVIMSSEGAIEHWSSIYLLEIVTIQNTTLSGIGFLVFSIMMTIGRFFGDGISAKIGSIKIIFFGSVFAILGYCFVLTTNFIVTSIGFGIIGLGLSVIIPEVFRIAGKIKGVKASVGISMVSGFGFGGFLLGPVVLGYISNIYNLKISFLTLLLLTVIVALITISLMFKAKTK
jgi:MFS family permease